MAIVNGNFTDGINGWTTVTTSCGSWLQSISPEPPNVHLKAQACAMSIYQDFTIDDTTLTFDWIYQEQWTFSLGGCDAHSSWSLTRLSDSVVLKGGNLTGSECNTTNSGMVIEDVSTYIGTVVRIQFNLYPSLEVFSHQADLWIGNVCISPNLGALDISSTPPGAKIFLDETDTGFITPKIITDITPTSHTIVLNKTGYYDNYTTVTTKPCRTNIINPTLTLIVGLVNGTFDTGLLGWNYNPSGYWPYCGATTRYVAWESGRAKIWAGYCNAAGGSYLNQTFNIAYSTLKFDYQTSTPSPWRYAPSWSLVIHDPILPDVTAYNESLPLNGTGTIQKDVFQYIGKSTTISFNTGGLLPGVCYGAYCGGSDWQGQYIWLDNVNVFEPACPTSLKYSGYILTLNATPVQGVAPYTVEFRRTNPESMANVIDISNINSETYIIPTDRLGGLSNPMLDATEGTVITRLYTINIADINDATSKIPGESASIIFAAHTIDSCTPSQYCVKYCKVFVTCPAPVCDFVVT